jgi:hypothetical protein
VGNNIHQNLYCPRKSPFPRAILRVPPRPREQLEHAVGQVQRRGVVALVPRLHAGGLRQPPERLDGGVPLRQLLIPLRFPHELHPLELHQAPELVRLEVLRLVLGRGVTRAHQQRLQQALGVHPVLDQAALAVLLGGPEPRPARLAPEHEPTLA